MKTILSISTFLFLILQTNLLNAQYQLGEKWVARYNAVNNTIDKAYDVAVDASGNVYITGPSNLDWATVKYNSAGVQQWVQRYHGSVTTGTNIPYAIAVDAEISKRNAESEAMKKVHQTTIKQCIWMMVFLLCMSVLCLFL